MLGIGLIVAGGAVALGSLFGLLNLSDEDATAAIDDEDLGEDLPLLDETGIDLLEQAFADDPLLAQGPVADEDDVLAIFEGNNDFSQIEGTDGPDFIGIPAGVDDADAAFGGGGDDVLMGNEFYNPMFGEDGDDVIFGGGEGDYLFGEAGDDTVSGGEGGDLVIGGTGSDVLYGGAGDDNIYDNGDGRIDAAESDVIVAGDGNDGIVIEDGINLVSLGEGLDHVTIHTTSDDDPGAVITDFDPDEDSLLLGVHAEDFDLPEGTNSQELTFVLREVETELGTGTLVEPAVEDEATAEALEGSSVSFAFLLGVTPQELADTEIRAVLTSGESANNADDGIFGIAKAMGATFH